MTMRLLFVLRRRWPVVLALVVVGAVAGFVAGPTAPKSSGAPTYQATALVSADQTIANQTAIQQDLIRAREGEVSRAVAEETGGGRTGAEVAAAIATDFDPDTFVAEITATGPTAATAEDDASAFATAFVEAGNGGKSSEQDEALATAVEERDRARAELRTFLAEHADQLEATPVDPVVTSERDALEGTYNAAQSAVDELQATQTSADVYQLINVGPARVQAASRLEAFSSPRFRVALGVVLGLLAAAAVIAVAERANPRIDDPATAAEVVGAPVLSMVPVLTRSRRRMIARADPEDFRGPYAEAFRTLRSHLEFRAAAEERALPPRIMVASAAPAEGKTTTAAFLALSYAESATPPVVIGGDLRRPSIHRLFGVERVPGLTSRSLPGGEHVPLTSIVRRDPISGVTLVPSGPSVDNVKDVLHDLVAVSEVAQASGQVVVLDTAPVRVANDAVDFLAAVDWVIVVVQAGRSTQRSVQRMMETLRMNGAEVAGVVMVGSAEAADATRDYYAYYAPEVRSRKERRREGREEREPAVAAVS